MTDHLKQILYNRKWTPQMDSVVIDLQTSIEKEIQAHFDNLEDIVLKVLMHIC